MPSGHDVTISDIEQQSFIQHDLPTHQVLLSMNSDWIAEAFIDWWHSKGRAQFIKWANQKKSEGVYR